MIDNSILPARPKRFAKAGSTALKTWRNAKFLRQRLINRISDFENFWDHLFADA